MVDASLYPWKRDGPVSIGEAALAEFLLFCWPTPCTQKHAVNTSADITAHVKRLLLRLETHPATKSEKNEELAKKLYSRLRRTQIPLATRIRLFCIDQRADPRCGRFVVCRSRFFGDFLAHHTLRGQEERWFSLAELPFSR